MVPRNFVTTCKQGVSASITHELTLGVKQRTSSNRRFSSYGLFALTRHTLKVPVLRSKSKVPQQADKGCFPVNERVMVADTDKIKQLRSYLNFKARITITDGRIFIGTFVCTDKEKNIILAHTEEFRGNEKRLVGLVMIPGKHIVKAETEDLECNPVNDDMYL